MTICLTIDFIDDIQHDLTSCSHLNIFFFGFCVSYVLFITDIKQNVVHQSSRYSSNEWSYPVHLCNGKEEWERGWVKV